MQTSMVFNQVAWPRAGDTDDCWCVSAIQCAHAVAPWLHLPGVPAFRTAAGDPDDGDTDGGKLAEIVRGTEGTWPVFAGKLRRLRGVPWSDLAAAISAGRPASVCVHSGSLPADLRYGFTGAHQVTLAPAGAGSGAAIRVANPLAPVYSRWVAVPPETIRAAVLEYGRLRTGKPGAWAVVFPAELEMLPHHPAWKAATAPLRDEVLAEAAAAIDGLRHGQHA